MKRYLAVGISVYLFEVLVIFAAQHAGASDVVAVGLGFWLGLIVSFGFQKLVAFQNKEMHHTVVLRQVALFSLLVIFNFGFTLAVTAVFSNVVPAFICRTVALGITTLWNFYLYNTRIFKTAAA